MAEEDIFYGSLNIILSFIFFIWTILVLKRQKDSITLAFSSSTIVMFVGTLLAGLGDFNTGTELETILWNPGFFLIVLTPLGILVAGYMILHGTNSWKNLNMLIFILVYVLLDFFILFGTQLIGITLEFTNLIQIAMFLIAIGFFSDFYVFRNVYNKVPDIRPKIRFLLVGFLLGIVGLVLDVILSSLVSDITPGSTGIFFMVIGMILSMLSFTNIPELVKISGKNTSNPVIN